MLHELEMFGAAVAIAFVTRANTILQIIGFLPSFLPFLRLFSDKGGQPSASSSAGKNAKINTLFINAQLSGRVATTLGGIIM